MNAAVDAFTYIAVGAGLFFFLAGTVGLLRFPDTLTRLHALTKADNLGLGLIVLGLLPQVDGVLNGLKLIAIWLLVLVSGADAGQLIARIARRRNGQNMIVDAFYAAPALLILALAAYTTLVRDTFPATVGYLAYGLLLTVAWVQLHGVDVALTEAAIGGGLTGMLLVRASAKLRAIETQARAETPRLLVRLLAGLMAAGVAGALAIALLTLPDPAPTLAPEAVANMASTGVGNPITAVLMAYRAMDTLLEAIVLLLALIGVWSLAPDRVWGGRPGPRYNADPDGILAFIARVLPPIGIIVGIYIFWVGADHPGGKFQGATIVAAMWLLTLMAGLVDVPPISRRWLRVLLVAGPVVFVAVGVAGVLLVGVFLGYPEGWAKPMILVIEFALMPSLALTLGLIMAGAPERVAKS